MIILDLMIGEICKFRNMFHEPFAYTCVAVRLEQKLDHPYKKQKSGKQMENEIDNILDELEFENPNIWCLEY